MAEPLRTADTTGRPGSAVRPAALWLLLGVVALAALLRFWGLGRESLWLDEATSLVVAQNPPAAIVSLTTADIHPPVYYLLLHVWLIFGQSEVALRSLSAVIGVLTVLALYGFSRTLWGPATAILAALLLAASPHHIWYSQEARMYGLVTLWAVLSSWLIALAWERRKWPYWAGYVLAVTLGMYTHYYMGFVVLAQNLFAGYMLLRQRLERSLLRDWVMAQLAWIILFAPWMPTVLRQVSEGGGKWVAIGVGRPSWRDLWDAFIAFTIGFGQQGLPVWLRRVIYGIYLAIVAGALWAIWGPRRKAPRPAAGWTIREKGLFCVLLCAAPIGIAWLASQVKPMYSLRYLLPCLPVFCLLIAGGLRAMVRRWELLGLSLAGLLVVINLAGTWTMQGTSQKPDWRSLAAYLVQEARAGDVVVPEPFWNAKPLGYYASDKLAIYDGVPLPATADGVAGAISGATAGRSRLWLVEDVGHYGDRERLLAGYLDTHYARLQTWIVSGIGQVALYQVRGNGNDR